MRIVVEESLLAGVTVAGVGRGIVDGHDASTAEDTGLNDGAELIDGSADRGRLLLLLLLLLGVGGGIFGNLDSWHNSLLEGLLALALGDNGEDLLLDWKDLLGDLAHWLNDFADLLDDWLDDLVDDTVGLLLGAGGLDLTLRAGNVHLLDGDWGGARSELNGDWGQVWLDDHDLGGDDVLGDWNGQDFLGAGSDDSGGDWADLDGWAGWADSGLDLGGTLGGEGTGKGVTSRSISWAFNGDWAGDDGSLLVGGDWRDKTVAGDGSLSDRAGVSGSGEEEDGSLL